MLISGEVVGNGNQVSDDSVFMSNEDYAPGALVADVTRSEESSSGELTPTWTYTYVLSSDSRCGATRREVWKRKT